MKRDRNSFFSSYGVTSSSSNPMQFPMMNASANSNMNMNMNMGMPSMNQNQTDYGYPDYEARINKLEREISRLDARISKLESATSSTINNNDYNFANSMYMV